MEKTNEIIAHEDALEKAFANYNEKLRQVIEQHKIWLEAELRKAHTQIAMLTRERDLLIKEALRLRNMVARIKEDLNDR